MSVSNASIYSLLKVSMLALLEALATWIMLLLLILDIISFAISGLSRLDPNKLNTKDGDMKHFFST